MLGVGVNLKNLIYKFMIVRHYHFLFSLVLNLILTLIEGIWLCLVRRRTFMIQLFLFDKLKFIDTG